MLDLKFAWIMITDFLPDDRHLSSVHKSCICSEAAMRSSSRDILCFFKRSLPVLWMAFLNNSIVLYDAYVGECFSFTNIYLYPNLREHLLFTCIIRSRTAQQQTVVDRMVARPAAQKNRKYEQPTLIIMDSFCARSHITVQYSHTMDKIWKWAVHATSWIHNK